MATAFVRQTELRRPWFNPISFAARFSRKHNCAASAAVPSSTHVYLHFICIDTSAFFSRCTFRPAFFRCRYELAANASRLSLYRSCLRFTRVSFDFHLHTHTHRPLAFVLNRRVYFLVFGPTQLRVNCRSRKKKQFDR